ncbi:unnamed protein product [Boreogadus saida]
MAALHVPVPPQWPPFTGGGCMYAVSCRPVRPPGEQYLQLWFLVARSEVFRKRAEPATPTEHPPPPPPGAASARVRPPIGIIFLASSPTAMAAEAHINRPLADDSGLRSRHVFCIGVLQKMLNKVLEYGTRSGWTSSPWEGCLGGGPVVGTDDNSPSLDNGDRSDPVQGHGSEDALTSALCSIPEPCLYLTSSWDKLKCSFGYDPGA